MGSFGGLAKITENCCDDIRRRVVSVLEINRTLSKEEAWFNQTVTPNSGLGEFEPNFFAINVSRLVGCHLHEVLLAEITAEMEARLDELMQRPAEIEISIASGPDNRLPLVPI